jgi:ABC-type sugar transport system permease subunit
LRVLIVISDLWIGGGLHRLFSIIERGDQRRPDGLSSACRQLATQTGAIWALVLTNIWFGVPFTMLMMGAALITSVPRYKQPRRRRQPWQFG